ncbi:MAG: 2-hydroxyacyl-CoA dehydratase [Deltaproteobacteria bacterium]|nr:2-hydroxyacyl-CoA dehydratase [Deltaproteobacteria bacterium]
MPARKDFQSSSRLKQIMADHFLELDRAAKQGSPKVAWCTSVGPAELLRGMGYLVYFPENHGALLGASRLATDLIPTANAMGYSPDICSYLTSDIGSYLKKVTPLTRAYGIESVPKPDVLVYNTNQCRDVKDWFTWYGREFDVPCIGVVTHREVGRVEEHHIGSIARQIRDLVPVLEEVSGRKLDMDRLKEAVKLSKKCTDLWKSVLDTAANVPSPLTFFDATIHMGPAVVARGTQVAVDYYEELLEELDERVSFGVAAVQGEHVRLYWEGMPIWGKLRNLSELFAGLKTCVAASTYCNSWIFEAMDPEEPFESMARAYLELFIARDEAYKEEYIKDRCEQFHLDGIVYHDAKTCPNNSNSRYGMPDRLSRELGIPALILNGDLNDLRCYSEEQATTNIEAFIEQIVEG